MKSQHLLGLPGITPACLLLMFVSLTPPHFSAQDSRSSMKNFQHVFVIMMENTGFDTLMGNPNAPFINAAATNYGLASNYFGVTHPSQPTTLPQPPVRLTASLTTTTPPSTSLTS